MISMLCGCVIIDTTDAKMHRAFNLSIVARRTLEHNTINRGMKGGYPQMRA